MAVKLLGQAEVGSIVKIYENEVLTDFYVAKHNYESEINGPGRTLLLRKDIYDVRVFHGTSTVKPNYMGTDLDTWLNNSYKILLDADIQNELGVTKIYCQSRPKISDTAVEIVEIERAVFVLSTDELGFFRRGDVEAEGTELSTADEIRHAYYQGEATDYWSRTMKYDYYYTTGWDGGPFCTLWWINGDGSGCSLSTSTYVHKKGTRPAFTLPDTLYLTESGEVTVNKPPSTPEKITVSELILGGLSTEISWSEASDEDGNLEGYILERSTDGGAEWRQVYQGSAVTTSNAVPFGTEAVMYRVKAYDIDGAESDYTYSAEVTVVNNVAPTPPPSITVPSEVRGGKSLTITWAASSDNDGNLSGYILERSTDEGASWAEVFNGDKLTFTDSVELGLGSVIYRVKAYDVYGFESDVTTSTKRTVINNHLPVITCAYENGASLGEKNNGFTVSYSVNDEDAADEITVTESLDGKQKRKFVATRETSYSFVVTGEYYQKIVNGSHTLTIEVSDGSDTVKHELTFTKLMTTVVVTLKEALPADEQITVCVLNVLGSFPEGSTLTAVVTNNGNDERSVWEDATEAVLAGRNYLFENAVAENGFAFNFRVTAKRGTSEEGGYITSIGGAFQ